MRHAMVLAMVMSGLVSGQELPEHADEIKTLTVEHAKALVKKHEGHGLHLNGLTTLTPEATAVPRAPHALILPDKFKK
jgi:hypothetical protein